MKTPKINFSSILRSSFVLFLIVSILMPMPFLSALSLRAEGEPADITSEVVGDVADVAGDISTPATDPATDPATEASNIEANENETGDAPVGNLSAGRGLKFDVVSGGRSAEIPTSVPAERSIAPVVITGGYAEIGSDGTNTPPTITLIGDSQMAIELNQPFVDPGATAFDLEDGDLTAQIIVTGTVNTSIVGSSTLTYRVTDSGGLSATKKRIVHILPEMYLPQMPACDGNFGRATDILQSGQGFVTRGFHYDNTPEHYAGFLTESLTSADSLDWHWIHPITPGNYVQWDLGTTTENLRVYPSQDHGPYPAQFNQYDVSVSLDGQSWSPATSTATYVDNINNVRTHDGVKDFVSASTTTFRYVRIVTNQLNQGADYEIDAIQACQTPSTNTPPTITLIGDNHMALELNQPFVDPGATAFDLEDGDLTAQIVVTGTVNTSVVGSSTLIYRVTDSGGLSVTKKRIVYVLPEMYLPQMPVCNGNFGRATDILHSGQGFVTRGFHYDNIPEHYVGLAALNLTSADNLDWRWIHPITPGNYVEWDLSTPTENLRVYPSQDHGPYPAQFNQYNVSVSLDGLNWIPATSTATYVDNINNVRTHDGVKDYISASSTAFRYVRIVSNQTSAQADYEVDAIQACRPPGAPGISVSKVSGVTTEAGGTFEFTISLDTEPSAPVTINLSSSDITEGVLSDSVIVLSTSTRESIVVVTGVDDSIVDGDVDYSIVFSSVVSADPNYNGLSLPSVSMKNLDNDTTPPPSGGGGGGGGGGGSSGGQRIFIPRGEVLGATTETPSCNIINNFLRQGRNNDIGEMIKLQTFLRDREGFSTVKVTGVFDNATFDAVSAFQERYKGDILAPWGLPYSTGYVYILTKKKVNEISCTREFPITSVEQKEITDSFFSLKKGVASSMLRQSAMSIDNAKLSVSTKPTKTEPTDLAKSIKDKNDDLGALGVIGEISATSTTNDALLAGGIKDKNSISSSRNEALKNLAAAVFTLPHDRSEFLQSLYYFLIILIVIYILTTIALSSESASRLGKTQLQSRKVIYFLIGLILALVGVLWFQILSLVIPLLILIILASVFLLWNVNKKEEMVNFSDSGLIGSGDSAGVIGSMSNLGNIGSMDNMATSSSPNFVMVPPSNESDTSTNTPSTNPQV